MALSKKSVELACNVFKQIVPNLPQHIYPIDIYSTDYITGLILGHDKKRDGGYEGICIHIRNVTSGHLQLFAALKAQVPNSSFVEHLNDGITRIGFY